MCPCTFTLSLSRYDCFDHVAPASMLQGQEIWKSGKHYSTDIRTKMSTKGTTRSEKIGTLKTVNELQTR